jgi:ribonuclease E
MPKKMLIDATHAEETRVVVVDGNKVEEFDFESENRRQLAGNIYLAKVTRVEPSLQAAFVDYGGNRHGFLAFSEIHPDYYQIPVADRQALLEEERLYAEVQAAKEDEEPKSKGRGRSRSRSRSKPLAQDATSDDAVVSVEIDGMETVDLSSDDDVEVSDDEASSPMERVAETPVEAPDDAEDDQVQNDDDDTDTDTDNGVDASSKDESIESVADEDDSDDIRPVRKPRVRRYKIQEVIKVRQILLIQVVKEERGNKGAALTTYLSLAGRYCVLMPNTARGGGISRKITNAVDRKKLKEIATEIKVPQGAGLIVRTAGAKRTRAEIKRDYEYLQRMWEQIRELTLKSIAPAKIYEEGDLIKRSIRDLYNRDIDEVFVEGERGYRIAKDFMKMIMPSHAKNVKRYEESLPLFARYQVEAYLAGMFNPTVQLPSGGYIVIDTTEALVAVDVNSGRATKEGSIEQTATKTNLEAAAEVARQLRLRDLAGLIVIDFIDMDERKNNAAVEKMIKDKLKTDRARIQIGRISGFGLMEMSRQRLRPGMIEATTQPCQACHGTGLIRSDDNLALTIIRQIEEEGTRRRTREVLIKAPVGIANFLMNQKREHITHIEARYGMSVRIEGEPHLVSPDFSMEKLKTAIRDVSAVTDPVVSVDTSLMDKIDEDDAAAAAAAEAAIEAEDARNISTSTPDVADDQEVKVDGNTDERNTDSAPERDDDGEGKPKRRRRRRSRGGKGRNNNQNRDENGDVIAENGAEQNGSDQNGSETNVQPSDAQAVPSDAPVEPATADAEEKPKAKRTTRSRSRKPKVEAETAADADAKASEPVVEEAPVPDAVEVVEKPKRKRAPANPKAKAEPAGDAAPAAEADAPAEAEVKPKRKRVPAKPKAEKAPAKPRAKSKAALAKEAAAAVATPEPAAVVDASPVVEITPEPAPAPAPVPEPVAPTVVAPEPITVEPITVEPIAVEPVKEEPKKPKKRGWWDLGR